MKGLIASLLSLSLLFVACNNDYVYDSNAPEVNFVLPIANTTYSPGDPLNVNIEISDDVFLEEFSFRIKGPENFDAAWDTTINYNLYGESSELLFNFLVPPNLPSGKYNLTCTAFDKRTRETKVKTSILIQSEADFTPPLVNLDSDTVTILTGAAFVRISGNITDEEQIKTVRFEVWDTQTNTLLELVEYAVNAQNYSINEFLSNPLHEQFGESGQYDIYVKAYDNVLNETTEKVVMFVQ